MSFHCVPHSFDGTWASCRMRGSQTRRLCVLVSASQRCVPTAHASAWRNKPLCEVTAVQAPASGAARQDVTCMVCFETIDGSSTRCLPCTHSFCNDSRLIHRSVPRVRSSSEVGFTTVGCRRVSSLTSGDRNGRNQLIRSATLWHLRRLLECWTGYLKSAVEDGPRCVDTRCMQTGCESPPFLVAINMSWWRARLLHTTILVIAFLNANTRYCLP